MALFDLCSKVDCHSPWREAGGFRSLRHQGSDVAVGRLSSRKGRHQCYRSTTWSVWESSGIIAGVVACLERFRMARRHTKIPQRCSGHATEVPFCLKAAEDMNGDALGRDSTRCKENEELFVEMKCLFYSVSRPNLCGLVERVSVLEAPDGERLMVIDCSKPDESCSKYLEELLADVTGDDFMVLKCSSCIVEFIGGGKPCKRVSVVEAKNGHQFAFKDRGLFAQSIWSADAHAFLDDYIDVFSAVCLLADAEGLDRSLPLGIAGFGGGYHWMGKVSCSPRSFGVLR
eukprot:TRINITY_DN13970_c1_g1_i1.p1 TRINITY_DN13970_c1_g1~~TRINITY_DN13970_c1_g1_i1.p1  ORF type:complete len:312 (-),score=49.49 TRINITY_DN13970_c1_g1_i1:62-922(-)